MVDVWYYAEQGRPVGPVDLLRLKDWLSKQEVWRDALVWRQGCEQWQRAGSVVEVAALPPPLPMPHKLATPVPSAQGRRWSVKKTLGGTITLICILTGATFGKVIGKAVYELAMGSSYRSADEALQAGLAKAEALMRPTLPRRIDDVTTLTAVSHEGRTISYTNKLDVQSSSWNNARRTGLRNVVIKNACHTNETAKLMKDGASLRYIYVDSNGMFLGSAYVDQSICAIAQTGVTVPPHPMEGLSDQEVGLK